MSFTAIFSGVVAIAKTIPAIKDMIDKFVSSWIMNEINKIDQNEITIREERKALMMAIPKAQTNEERKALSVTLHNLNIK
jgi:hypothetical protein